MEPINIFLDSTVTFDDPFFKKNFNSQLLRIAEIHRIPIFMSKIVFEETRNNFEALVVERIRGLEKALYNLELCHPLHFESIEIKRKLGDFLNEFDKFYSDLFARKVIQLIEYDNNMLPVLIERSMKRIKPFGNKKQEFRDAITWLSYVRYANDQELINCFFITANISDFCDNNTKNTIHPDLLKDSNKFSHYVSASDLFSNEEKITPYIKSADITEWLSTNSVDREIILHYFKSIFLEKLNEYFYNYDAEDLINVSLPRGLWVTIEDVEIADIEDEIYKTIISEQLVIKGDIFLSIDVSLQVENDFNETYTIGTSTAQIVTTYTFTMDQENTYVDTLEFSNIDAFEKADFKFIYEDYDRER